MALTIVSAYIYRSTELFMCGAARILAVQGSKLRGGRTRVVFFTTCVFE